MDDSYYDLFHPAKYYAILFATVGFSSYVSAHNLSLTETSFCNSIFAMILHQGTSLRKTVEHKFVGAAVKERLEKFAQYGSSHYEGKQASEATNWQILLKN
jgi:hypothetical protein